MKLCPKCRNLSFYNSYFQAFMCSECDHMWRDSEFIEKSDKKYILKKQKVQNSVSSLKTKQVTV